MPASLSSLNIRGVRSYSPLENKTQVIEFMPLTLIVGANGSGKTTIIEALKFMISGQEPPLSDYRRNFLHMSKEPNPKLGARTYAAVQLDFQNTKGEYCTAKREISLAGPAKNATPPISSCYKLGNQSWTNVHKQDDWNRTVPLLFNLPNQAILNHVILCHQEDNLWCMSDSSTVKQIFDKILGCQEYKKEIKHIDAELKECKTLLAYSEKDMTHNRERVEQMDKLENEMKSLEEEICNIGKETRTLDQELERVNCERESVNVQLRSIETFATNMKILEGKAAEIKVEGERLHKSLREPPISQEILPTEELEKKIQDHSAYVETVKTRQTAIRKQEISLKFDIKMLEERQATLQDDINSIKVLELRSKDTYDGLIQNLNNLKIEQSLDDIQPYDLTAAMSILEKLEAKLLQDKSDQVELEDSLSREQQKLSRKISDLEGMYQGLLHKVKSEETFVGKLSDQLAQADPIAKDLVLVATNLDKMSTLCTKVESSSLMKSLDDLISESRNVIGRLVVELGKDHVAKLTNEINKENMKIADNKSLIETLEGQKGELSARCRQVEDDHSKVRTTSKEAHNRVVTFKNARLSVLKAYESYQSTKRSLDSKNMVEKVANLDLIRSQISASQSELDSLSCELTRLSLEMEQSFEKAEEYRHNRQIRDCVSRLTEVEQRISAIKNDPKYSIDFNELQERFSKIDRESLNIRDKRSSISGSKLQIDRDLQRVKTDLRGHAKTNSTYAESIGKVVCNRIVISDLEKLKDCFQTSITSFHNQMIVKINEVLRARWRAIYRGSDIDYIELVDEEITKGKDKKTYNYYVGMSKAGLRMKMREKGSAGQKALASIILRITLAELFVKDFAFIALDEPTANLDKANVQSLATAIGSYVKRRTSKGANIQWIIITHDEQFLQALDSISSPYYYRIQMDHEGCSKVVKTSYEEYQKESVSQPSSSSEGSSSVVSN